MFIDYETTHKCFNLMIYKSSLWFWTHSWTMVVFTAVVLFFGTQFIPATEVAELVRQMLSGLAHGHAQGQHAEMFVGVI